MRLQLPQPAQRGTSSVQQRATVRWPFSTPALHRKKRVRELIALWRSAPRGDWLLLIVGTAEEFSAGELAAQAGPAEDIAIFDGAGRRPRMPWPPFSCCLPTRRISDW